MLASYTKGSHAGEAAITMNTVGSGKAVYIGADLDAASLARVLRTLSGLAGVKQPLEVPPGVEVTVRRAGDKQWIFVLNHGFAECKYSENFYRFADRRDAHGKS